MTQREERIQDDRIRVTPEIVNKEAIKTRYETRQSHKSSSRARLSQTLPHFGAAWVPCGRSTVGILLGSDTKQIRTVCPAAGQELQHRAAHRPISLHHQRNWMGVIVHSAQSVYFAFLILGRCRR